MLRPTVSLALLAVLLGSCLNFSASQITVTPSSNIPVPITSDANINYTCTVDSERRVLWEIQGTQLLSTSTIEGFRDIGILIEEGDTNSTSTVVITADAREYYLNLSVSVNVVTVQCNSFLPVRPPIVTEGSTFRVISYGPPDPPADLEVSANPNQLTQIFFTWSRPTNIPEGVETNYTVVIAGARINMNMTTSDLSFSFMDEELSDCQVHNFSVFASNAAGSGEANETSAVIPISPLVNTITESSFRLSSLRLDSNGGGTIELTFPPATTCGDSFPIERYIVQVVGFPVSQTLTIDNDQPSANLTVTFPIEGDIRQGEVYFFEVTACISSNCRTTPNRFPISTTDVQQSSITFFENNVLLTCTFADEGFTRGCLITLILIDGEECFYLERPSSGTVATQCNVTTSQREAYDNSTSFAVDWLGGMVMMVGRATVGVMGFEELDTEAEFTETTGCVIPGPPGGLSAGAIVGIVFAIIAIVVIVLGIVIVVAVFGFKVRDDAQLAKVEKADGDDEFTVDIMSNLLMEDKPKKKSSVKKTGKVAVGHATPDAGERAEPQFDAIDIRTAAAQLPENLPPEEESTLFLHSMTTPQSMAAPMQAITLAIKPGEKRVRLHLNKALIRRVLEQNDQLKSLDRRSMSGMKSFTTSARTNKKPSSLQKQDSRLMSLPLTSCIVMPQEDEGTDKGQLGTIQETEAR